MDVKRIVLVAVSALAVSGFVTDTSFAGKKRKNFAETFSTTASGARAERGGGNGKIAEAAQVTATGANARRNSEAESTGNANASASTGRGSTAASAGGSSTSSAAAGRAAKNN